MMKVCAGKENKVIAAYPFLHEVRMFGFDAK